MNPEKFKAELEASTLAYEPRFRSDDRTVTITLGPEADCPAGHVLLIALVNQLARTHRRLVIVGDLERPLLCRDPFGAVTLSGASAGLASAINPFLSVEVLERPPVAPSIADFSIGGGDGLALGSRRWSALAGPEARIGQEGCDIWGAMLAATLGAWFAFTRALGEKPSLPPALSLWEFCAGESSTDPSLSVLPNPGRVLQVGSGGVGGALDYWLGLGEMTGRWTIVDGDLVEAGNLNRQLAFDAADAGYPDLVPSNKAAVAARRLGAPASFDPHWFGESAAVVEADYDLVLALANEGGVREALQDRRPDLLLHATTSRNHQAQLHRHLRRRDDCIRCRLPGEAARTACATAPIAATGSDAALPYLSGMAGLLLLSAIARRKLGALDVSEENLALVDLGGPTVAARRLRMECRSSCRKSRLRQ